jgi:hypothetical protein
VPVQPSPVRGHEDRAFGALADGHHPQGARSSPSRAPRTTRAIDPATVGHRTGTSRHEQPLIR